MSAECWKDRVGDMLRTGVCELTPGTGGKSPGKKNRRGPGKNRRGPGKNRREKEIAGENGEKRMCRNR